MDNKRGMEGGRAMGEVVDVQSGAVEDLGMGRGVEVMEQGAGEKVGETDGGVAQAMPAQPVVQPAVDDADVQTDETSKIQGDLVNLTTKDGEKIEKEWVDKVRNVISETRDDPRRREDDIFEVKKDFIKKRFGREIGGGK